ncbi:serine/threonine-protein kinase [Streptomyces sp. NPDC014636]|uniref:serine/threonine-protein kinase n=1 Tax=Streptomyces sp. NPDC014636 TaxID=3364876 RepID=UPI0037012A62
MRLRQSALALSRCSTEVLAGRYRLDSVIGSGGAGDVHRGFDLRLKRAVAVKVFRAGAEIDMEERFDHEAVILARLQHPGLVTVYDAGRHNGRAYLVMELIEGPTLKERIATRPLAPGEAADIGADLARALAHAHEAGIVHRDVKPSNIILDMSGRPHLTDFGISRLLDSTTRTATGALVGTAAYLSPEQVLGQPVGPPADVYALGLVLLECITSRLEYDGGPLEAAIARLHRRPELPGFLPERLAALLRDMTALEGSARPSAHDCARTLTALADTSGRQAVSSAAGVTSLTRREAPGRDDFTHPRALHTAGAAPSRTAPGRGRLLVVGGAAALAAAAMAGTLALSDGSAHQANGDKTARAASSPHPEADSPGTPAPERKATTVAAASTTRDASAGQLPARASGHSSGSSFVAPSREQVAGTAAHDPASPPPPSTAGGASEDRGGKPHLPQHAEPQTQASGERSHKSGKTKPQAKAKAKKKK